MKPLASLKVGGATTQRLARAMARSGLSRFSVARFLGALVLLFVTAPFIQGFREGRLIETGLGTLVMCLGVLAVGAHRRTFMVATALVVPALLCTWANHLWPEEQHLLVAVPATKLLFLVFVVERLITFILRAPRVDSEVLCAGVSSYLLLGLVWAIAYVVVAQITPDAFSLSLPPSVSHKMDGFNSFYFSFITLTTVGYGDITPVSNAARTLAMLEAMTGTLFVAMLIARLVSLYSSPAEKAPPSPTPNPTPSQRADNSR